MIHVRVVVLAAIAFLLLLWCLPAKAVQLSREECGLMSIWTGDLIWARDMGASKEKVQKFVDDTAKEAPFFVIIQRNFETIWEAKITRLEMIQQTYGECYVKRGNYGQEI